ncbi:hypothetical protein CsSME_00008283 [Camellia sinensis var. sinensis]
MWVSVIAFLILGSDMTLHSSWGCSELIDSLAKAYLWFSFFSSFLISVICVCHVFWFLQLTSAACWVVRCYLLHGNLGWIRRRALNLWCFYDLRACVAQQGELNNQLKQ